MSIPAPTSANLCRRKRFQASFHSDRSCRFAGATSTPLSGAATAGASVALIYPYRTRGSSTPYSKSATNVKNTTRIENTMMMAMMTGVSLF